MKFRSLFACLLVVVTAGLLNGQTGGNSSILGTVTDNSGAVVANASVNITNVNTGQIAHTTTGSSGDFTVPSLNSGNYSVTVEAPGFQKSVTNDISLSVDQKARVNVSLKAGAVSTTVEVNATAVNLDTDTSALSNWSASSRWKIFP